MPVQNPSPFISLIPMLIMMIPFVIMNGFIAKRKGRSPILYVLLGIIPFVNFFSFFFLISLTDKEVVDKIDRILEKLEGK